MHDLPLLTTIAAGFAAAWALGLVTHWLKLSPIVGYLIAGVMIGPHTPGFVGDAHAAAQLAEIGVILLMFGIGLRFHFKDLLKVKSLAVPGAIGQSVAATLVALLVFHLFGWPLPAGLVLGMAMAVASTVVLMRVLLDNNAIDTEHGHVAVGWLIVEDILTVLMLVLIPLMAGEGSAHAAGSATEAEAVETIAPSGWSAPVAILWATIKLAALIAIILAGSRFVPWILTQVARLRSRELFTLTVLVLSVAVAVGVAAVFDVSVALGAFLAGMVVGQSTVSHEAAAEALPMRDAFAVLFFVSVGMLFDPMFVVEFPLMVGAALLIVMLVKPLTAIVIVTLLGYSSRTALTVALGLAQIGEFSFILSQLALHHELIPVEGHNLVVAAAIVSITISPLLFRSLSPIERWLHGRPRLWRMLNRRSEKRMHALNVQPEAKTTADEKPLAIIIGYGPAGRVVDALLCDAGFSTVIVELNVDTVHSLRKNRRRVIFGDATRRDILEQAGIRHAVHLVVTLPHSVNNRPLILTARRINPNIEVTVRARYLSERESLQQAGASRIAFEEGEAGIALARHVMERRGLDEVTIEKMLDAIRRLWRMRD